MKILFLIIQIPCLNESESLPYTIAALPKTLSGISKIEILIVDDGSTDKTIQVAHDLGVHHIVRHRKNRGLAAAFQTGIDTSLALGADIIVNTDADNQYDASDMGKLVDPILSGSADIVIGDRQVNKIAHFSQTKKNIQWLGSAVVRQLSETSVVDAVSGYRAISRYAAKKIFIASSFSYTTEMIIQAGRKGLSVTSVPINTNYVKRPSRLFSSVPTFVCNTAGTILRAYAMYNPLKVFLITGLISVSIGILPFLRFIYFYAIGQGSGHIQSLVAGSAFFTFGMMSILMGILADLISRNRQLLELVLQRSHQIEDQLTSRESIVDTTAANDHQYPRTKKDWPSRPKVNPRSSEY